MSSEALDYTLSDEDELVARPFVKWAGGKAQLIPEIIKRIPKKYNTYYEPFVGGGAVFFALRPQKAVLADINSELINTYEVIRSNLQGLMKELSHHRYEEEYYYRVRAQDRDPLYSSYSPVQRAARFIYLNKTCYNGLYRVNKSGFFNTPFGKYTNPTILDQKNLTACNVALKNVECLVQPFDSILERAEEGDFVYLDPPYAPLSATSDFTSYTREGFGPDMQRKLAEVCVQLDKKGVRFLLSNSSADEIRELYQNFQIDEVYASRAINSKAAKRGSVVEFLIRNYT